MNEFEAKIQTLKLVLPPPPKPVGSYRPVMIHGNTAYMSGQIAKAADGTIHVGKVGSEIDLAAAQKASRVAAINVIAVIRDLIGFDKFDRFVRVAGFVQCAPNFYDISSVMNPASDLFIEVFGDRGIHTRTSVGMASLPLNSAVEIEATIALKS